MTTEMIEGVDLASFQGRPANWRAVAGPVDWAAVKITELQPGGKRYVDPFAAADWAALRRQGRGRVAYLFGRPSTSPAASVEFFLTELDALGLHDSDAVSLDHEETDGRPPAQVADWGLTVVQQLKHELGRRPLVYTFLDFAEQGCCAGLGEYPLWIADPSRPAGQPRVPRPWTTWTMHQYVTGGQIDRDVARFPDPKAMAAGLGKPYSTTGAR